MQRLGIVERLAVGLVMLMLVSACGAQSQEAEDTPDPGTDTPNATATDAPPGGEGPSGEIVIGFSSDVSTMDPQAHSGYWEVVVESSIFDSLIARDAENQLIPGLAESWEAVDDTTWEFKLRRGVEFHNGEPFNADAVKYSYERIKDPDFGAPLGFYFDPITEIEVVDDYTVRFHTDEPLAILPLNISTRGYILPPGYLEEVGDEEFSRAPIGTGPYEFVEWQADTQIILTANEDYWGGPPAVRDVVFRILPEASTRLNELRTGGIDVNMQVLPDQVELLEGDDNLKVTSSPVLRFAYILIEPEGPLEDVRVRQALNHAVNFDAYIEHIYGGDAFRVPSFVSPLVFGYDESIEGYEYDPERARQLLEEAGYADGFTTQLNVEAGRVPLIEDVVQAMAEDWASVGVNVELNIFTDRAALVQQIQAGEAGPMLLATWGYGNVFDADNLLYPNFYCGQTYSMICDEEIDRLLDAERTTFDESERERILIEIQERLLDEALGISMLGAMAHTALLSEIEWEPTGDENFNIWRDIKEAPGE